MDSVEDVGSELEEAGAEGGSEILYEIVMLLLLLRLLEDMLLKYREETNAKGPASMATTQYCPTQHTNNQFCVDCMMSSARSVRCSPHLSAPPDLHHKRSIGSGVPLGIAPDLLV